MRPSLCMPATQEPEVRSVAASKQEALRALLNSLVPGGQMSLPGDADIDKLAEKLDELLAGREGLGAYTNIPRDDQGRVLNEEGLPIMEIIEPAASESSVIRPSPVNVTSPLVFVSEQAPLSPLPNWALSPAALAARRRERDRILDILEREEQEQFAREAAAVAASDPTEGNKPGPSGAPRTPPVALDQVIQPSKTDTRLSGPAPSSSLPSKSESEGSSRHSEGLDAATTQETRTARKPKKQKSVSFADPSMGPEDQPLVSEPALDWGDVIPVRIDSSKPGPAKSHGAMKDLVVERPFAQSSAVPGRVADSDDEDEEMDEVHDMAEDEDSETEVPKEALGRLETSDDETEAEEGATEATDIDDTDFDEAMLQREIALAYYARRNQMGAGVMSGPLFDPTTIDEIPSHDNVEADRLDAGDIQSNTTRFRQSRLRTDPQTLINSAVQFGRVVDGQLVVDEIADKEVDASVNALTSGGNPSREDMTEKTIELLRSGDTWFSNHPTNADAKPTQQIPEKEPSSSIDPSSQASGSDLGSLESSDRTPATISKSKPKPKPNSNPVPLPPANQGSSRKPTPTSQPPQPIIIESGFGFDPAFQIAPKPRTDVGKPVAPMSETVKERVPTADLPSGAVRAKGGSRFAQAQRHAPPSMGSNPLNAPSANTGASNAVGRDVMERSPNPTTGSKLAEPAKRVSRFRAERAGWL